MSRANGPLLSLRNIYKSFPVRKSFFSAETLRVHAVDSVSIDVPAGKTVGLVGESGCGKTTLGRVAIRLIPPDSGRVIFEGRDITSLSGEELRRIRRKMQIIFQDPYSSLNPRMRVRDIVGEGWRVHGIARGGEVRERAEQLLRRVGLSADAAEKYPHEFSGGQRQRIGIARAIALSPRLVVADEPVSALDVSVQAQILNLLRDIQEEFGIAYLFVSHDLRVIRHVSDTVAVMYLGKLMEVSPAADLFRVPLHPYSRSLLSAVPMPGGEPREKIVLRGEIPSPIHVPPGCRFHTRCFMAEKRCEEVSPLLRESAPGRFTACHFV
ncbi:MAG TPA: oligopeptide/dipeptide ABC transporter ATP-binding protein [Candidatus Deferrimicrobiaceae bacterium]|nr:oligopeptide/dipeptide ABC transporter ATP-binding protein [Candidatus Deferrimicrobiaceae bacterium]